MGGAPVWDDGGCAGGKADEARRPEYLGQVPALEAVVVAHVEAVRECSRWTAIGGCQLVWANSPGLRRR